MVRRVIAGASVPSVAADFAVSEPTVRKWLRRFHELGEDGLRDRSSRPARTPTVTPVATQERILALRRERLVGMAIARALGLPRSTVGRVLRRNGLGRLHLLEPAEPVRRYERATPGELLHLDIKKLARFDTAGHRVTGDRTVNSRGAGWEFVHVAIDDHSRVSYVEVLADEKGDTTTGFLERALAWFEANGVVVQRVMTDNGSAYRSRTFNRRLACGGIRHIYTRPYTPRTNGKAERFIQTLLREWAYRTAFPSSQARREALPDWLHGYNCHRPHGALGRLPPVTRLATGRNDVLGFDI